jgi:hypothetical protein
LGHAPASGEVGSQKKYGKVAVTIEIKYRVVNRHPLVGGAITILKNDGKLVNGFWMTSLFYEMEKPKKMFQTTNQSS